MFQIPEKCAQGCPKTGSRQSLSLIKKLLFIKHCPEITKAQMLQMDPDIHRYSMLGPGSHSCSCLFSKHCLEIVSQSPGCSRSSGTTYKWPLMIPTNSSQVGPDVHRHPILGPGRHSHPCKKILFSKHCPEIVYQSPRCSRSPGTTPRWPLLSRDVQNRVQALTLTHVKNLIVQQTLF